MMSRAAAVAAILLLAACAGPRPPIPPGAAVVPPEAWRDARSGAEATINAAWWANFGDPTLSKLISDAIEENDDLAMSAARVEEARAQLAAARGAQLPVLQAAAAGGRTRSVNPFGIDVKQWAAQGELQSSFDLDLFGRLRNSTAAARASLLANSYNRDTVRLAVVTAVANTYVQLRTADARLDILRRTLEARGGTLNLIRRRAEAGYGSQLDLAQAEAEYEATAQAIPPVELAIARLENGLSILLGRTPAPIERGKGLEAITVPVVPVQLPSAILRRRPDLAASEQQIVAADHTLDASRAAFMPNFSLSASGGFVSSSLLPNDPLSIYSLGSNILAPIFNGGRIRAQAAAAAARRDQAAFGYRRAALTAFREVEDGMASVQKLGEQEAALVRQHDALARTQALAFRRYKEGYSPYLEQLDAERSLLSSDLAVVQNCSDRLIAAITLYQALGGGWKPLPQPE